MAAVITAAQELASPVETGLRSLLEQLHCAEDVLRDTPGRFARAFAEMTSGYDEDPAEILARRFDCAVDDLIILKDVEFTSLCEHHLMPFTGHVHLAYVPDGFVVGLSKLARVVDCFARRLQIQERLCADIAGSILKHVSQRGAACVIEASHGCLSCRGARKQSSTFITSSMLGMFRDMPQLRAEFFNAIQVTHSRV